MANGYIKKVITYGLHKSRHNNSYIAMPSISTVAVIGIPFYKGLYTRLEVTANNLQERQNTLVLRNYTLTQTTMEPKRHDLHY